MGIQDVRAALADIPGADKMTMRYERGGAVQVFMIGDREARVGPMATDEQIRAAFLKGAE